MNFKLNIIINSLPHSYRQMAGLFIRVRVKDPERIIGVPGCVDVDGAGCDQSVRVQTPGPVTLTFAACMLDITVQEYGAEIVCERDCPHILDHGERRALECSVPVAIYVFTLLRTLTNP